MEKKTKQSNANMSRKKSSTGLFDKVKTVMVNAVDQNCDGKLNMDDVVVLANSVKDAVKESGERWNEKQDKTRRERELKSLRPIFPDDIDEPDFSLPKLIRVAEMDEEHAESEVCRGSIGYIFSGKALDVMTIYSDRIEAFNLKFYPDMESELYYVDPTDRDFYIALDNYFYYLKVARIGELQRIAQDLGAKHFRVTYKEYQNTASLNAIGVKANGKVMKLGGKIDSEHHVRSEDLTRTEIAADMICVGHKPIEPTLAYFKTDPQIQNLVSLRMSDNALTHQVYTLNLSNSSGIKVKDAHKIDDSLRAMKIDGGIMVTNEALSESRTILEYEIDF